MLYAHVVIMLYAHVVSSYYCTLGLYACASVNPMNSRDRSSRSPCVDYTTTFFTPQPFLHQRCFCMRYHYFCKVHALLCPELLTHI